MAHIKHTVERDVLVIGGAGAAVMSAVRAQKAGASVALAAKGKVGKSGNTIMIGGGFSVDGEGIREVIGEAEANPAYTRKAALEKLMNSGFYLGDKRLQKIFVEQGPLAVRDCLAWAKNAGQLFAYNAESCSWRVSGAAFGKTVKQGIREHAAISVYEDIIIAELLENNGRICGAVGIDVFTGDFILFKAKAVILASGGFQPFSIKNSHSDMTGDGIALALRAGARVCDMEFLLFIGTILEPAFARGSIMPFLFTVPGLFPLRPKITDLDGEEIPFPQDSAYKVGPTNGKVNKLLMADFYGRRIYQKFDTCGNAFYYDYADYSADDLRAAFGKFGSFQKNWHREGFYNGIDLGRLCEEIIRQGKRMKVAFGNEYSMGGVIVEPDFSAGVPGLFAAGEVSGGTFGAFRSGDGLTEMLVHGLVAGESAAAFAKNNPQLEPAGVDEKMAALLAPFGRPEGTSPIEVRAELERICDQGFDFFRDGARLEKAYGEISRLRRSLNTLAIPGSDRRYNLEWINALAVQNLALCAEPGIYAALNRRESRGTHLRADFPTVNNQEYLFSFTASLQNGTFVYDKQRPPAPPHDSAVYPSVSDFLAERVLASLRACSRCGFLRSIDRKNPDFRLFLEPAR
jgi:succinate dehydrogenase / fumarate reductase flavoprotein subunit